MRQGDYEIHIAREGFASIVHAPSGEILHARTPPMEEARSLYAEQARLTERLLESGPPLVVWDVGLGAAANAVAAIECFEAASENRARRGLHIVSFENDLSALRLALDHLEKFPYLRREGPAELMRRGRWENGRGLSWELLPGDFAETLRNAPGPPDVIFFDMFSSRTIPGPWRWETLRALRQACGAHPVELFTYTLSTAARATFLAAGFWVARGQGAGAKTETTVAMTPAAKETERGAAWPLLGREWLEKWRRSTAKFPLLLDSREENQFGEQIESHPQFRHAICRN